MAPISTCSGRSSLFWRSCWVASTMIAMVSEEIRVFVAIDVLTSIFTILEM